MQMPLSSMLPATTYFEVDSAKVGSRFAVWVTLPPRYEREPETRYPAICQPDGNLAAPMLAPNTFLLRDDPINPIRPFIHFCVGYAGDYAKRVLAVRARDLLPPGEALPAAFDDETLFVERLVAADVFREADARLCWRYLHNPAADKFLDFLSEELHPLIAERYRVDESALGLHGYSYGGLFATYAALRRSRFRRIGAGSPGILPRTSKVFELYAAERAADADHSGRMLHMTVCEKEFTAPSLYPPTVGSGTVEFMHLASQQALKGLAFSTHITPYESHATGGSASWFSHLRTCYGAGTTTGM
jgi:uncharacterized protein